MAMEEDEISTLSLPSACESFSNRNTKPSWLSSTLADIEQRIRLLAMKNTADVEGDSFAERAEFYYHKRPQLLALLHDLYTAYTTLSDRYVQTVAKHQIHHHHRQYSLTSTIDQESFDRAEESGISQIDSDAESSLSYQQQLVMPAKTCALLDTDIFLAEFVMKNVEYDILINEVSTVEKQCNDSSRKIELQKSLLEVLESERLILLNENARLGHRVASLTEENKGLVAESVFTKRKAGEMARCMLKIRDDHKVYILSRKVEDLQGQIYGLEKRNKEYYEQLVKADEAGVETERIIKNRDEDKNEVTLEACLKIGKHKLKSDEGVDKRSESGKKASRWWAKVKSMDMFLCGQNTTNPTS